MSFLKRFFGARAGRHYRSGMKAFEACRYEEALAAFQRAMQCRGVPGDPMAHLAAFYAAESATCLGRAALERGAADEALSWLEPGLQWNPRSPALLELAAAAYLEGGALEASWSCVQGLLRLDPQRLGARLLAALLCQARQEPEAARQHMQDLRDRWPPSGVVSRALTRILEARLHRSTELATLLQDIVSSSHVLQV